MSVSGIRSVIDGFDKRGDEASARGDFKRAEISFRKAIVFCRRMANEHPETRALASQWSRVMERRAVEASAGAYGTDIQLRD